MDKQLNPQTGATMKQKAIEIITRYLIMRPHCFDCGCPEPCEHCIERAEKIYDCLAALCEFPEEDLRTILTSAIHLAREGTDWEKIRTHHIKFLKRRWPFNKPTEGACLKCGGKGKYRNPGADIEWLCPQCGGSGEERREGEERRSERSRVMLGSKLVYACYSEELKRTVYVFDGRTKPDRRKAQHCQGQLLR